jgi:hypothetical protein
VTYQLGDKVSRSPSATVTNYYKCVDAPSRGDNPDNSFKWLALRGDSRVRVTGVEGLFRLAKPLMYGFFNGFDITPPASGSSPGTFVASSPTTWFDLDSLGVHPFDTHESWSSNRTFATLTQGGTMINPYRIKAASGVVTRPELSANPNTDEFRVINGEPIKGGWQSDQDGNDSRDKERTSADKWGIKSLMPAASGGFDGLARTSLTNGKKKTVPKELLGEGVPQSSVDLAFRPMEPQVLEYRDWTSPTTTAEERAAYLLRGPDHDAAKPVFVDTTITTLPTSTNFAALMSATASGELVESPGYFLQKALGGLWMKRKMDSDVGGSGPFIGWTVTQNNGTEPGVMPMSAGIVIRERPVPDFTYFGLDRTTAGAYLPDRRPSGVDFLPYAYGKHKYGGWPFTEMWVSSQSSGVANVSMVSTDGINHVQLSGPNLDQTYTNDPANGGLVQIKAVVRSGGAGCRDNTWGGAGAAPVLPSDVGTNLAAYVNTDTEGFFRDNWRFIHLKRINANIVKKDGPVVDLAATDNYINKNRFHYVQTRIMPDANGNFIVGGQSGAKAGLMIRPFAIDATVTSNQDLTTYGINSRGPFAAITFSQESGIQVQRRLVASVATTVQSNAVYYTATGPAPGNGKPAVASVTITKTDPVAAVYAAQVLNRTTAPAYTDKRVPDSGWTASKALNPLDPPYSTSFTIDNGEGSSTSPTFNFEHGPATYSYTYSASRGSSWIGTRSLSTAGVWGSEFFTLSAATTTNYQQGMGATTWPNGWLGKNFYIAGASPRNFDLSGSSIDGVTYNVGRIQAGGFINSTTYRIFRTFDGYGKGAIWTVTNTPTPTTWTSVPQTSPKVDTARHIYTSYGDYGLALEWFKKRGLNETILRSRLNEKMNIAGTYVSAPSDFTPPILTLATGGVEPGPPTIPTVSQPDPRPIVITSRPGTYSVAIERTGQSAKRIESNSWISNRGTWFSPPVLNKILLYQANSADIPPDYLDPLGFSTTTPALNSTGSFRPDQYTGSAIPGANWSVGSTTNDAEVPLTGNIAYTDANTAASRTGFNTPIVQAVNSKQGVTNRGTQSAVAVLEDSLNASTQRLWEDTPVPCWYSGAKYNIENAAASVPASIVWHNNTYWKCKAGHTSAVPPSSANSQWEQATHVWLRIERLAAPERLCFKFLIDTTAPNDLNKNGTITPDYRWRTVTSAVERGDDGMPVVGHKANDFSDLNVPATWSNNLLVGPCVASARYSVEASPITSSTSPVTVTFSNLRWKEIGTASTVYHDSDEWDAATQSKISPTAKLNGRVVDATTSYLCSQYQVFWGGVDITEDFFSYTQGSSGVASERIATEEWINNPRFYWSQSRWWNEGDLTPAWGITPRADWREKETGTTSAPSPIYKSAQREWMARTTLLKINMASFQSYLQTRTLTAASYKWSTDTSTLTNADTIGAHWNGILYAARTNRYPRNPSPNSPNPYNQHLPNRGTSSIPGSNLVDLGSAWTPAITRARLVATNAADRGVRDFAIASQDFHHGVAIANAADINWAYTGDTTEFGVGKMSIITPNNLYVMGDLNNTLHNYTVKGVVEAHYTPISIMADSVTLLSNAFNAANYRIPNVIPPEGALDPVDSSVMGWRVNPKNPATLSTPRGTKANLTSYRAVIITNNQPTTKYRAFEGEGAPFINTQLFLEDWSGVVMNYTGSLVVLDTCRYNRSYLLQDSRQNGRSPYGLMGWQAGSTWASLTGNTSGEIDWCFSWKTGAKTALTEPGSDGAPFGSLPVYSPPVRNFSFNDDLLTEGGTPPFIPFGVTAAGVAGWVRVVE